MADRGRRRYWRKTTMPLWRAALFVVFAAFVTTRSSQASEPWPTRNVTVVVPFGPGGAADGAARLFADRLSKRWGRAVVVENRPGAEAILGTGAFVRDQETMHFSTARHRC